MYFQGSTAFNIQRDISAAIFILNNSVWTNSVSINMFIDDDFFYDKSQIENAIEEKQMEAFLTCFIKFVEENMSEVRTKIIQTSQQNENKKIHSLVIAWEILKAFFYAHGMDLELNLQLPKKVDFDKFFGENSEDENLVDTFAKLIRREIKNWKLIPKMHKLDSENAKNCCFYDNDFLYIPTKIFERMLRRNGYLNEKFEFLSKLKNENFLKTINEQI